MARSLYECFRSNNDTSDRRTKPFAKTHRHAIETRAIIDQRARAGGDGFPEAGAVEVQGYGGRLGAGPGGDGAAVREGEDCAEEGVFEGEEAGGGEVRVGGLDGVVLDVGEG